MDFDPTPFNMAASFQGWLVLVGILALAGLLLGLLGAFASGGKHGSRIFTSGLQSFLKEIFTISPRRVMALMGLTIKEALRRKALMVFVLFAILLMFGGWFLTDSNDRVELQRAVHVTFMLTVISWLIIPVVMFLSCWGIPEDIRLRSLHTVVTKPVRRVEVVLGRILGFVSMSSVMLVLMAVVGFIWIQRQYPTVVNEDGTQENPLTCRVPKYGTLYFLNQVGLPVAHGVNVGDPWLYRSFVLGNSRARAVWLFGNITEDNMGDELRLESGFEAFRTIKGSDASIKGGLEAQYTLVNDLREEAFSPLAVGASFRPVAEALRDGQFLNAADMLDNNAERMLTSTGESDFPQVDCYQVYYACNAQVIPVLESMDDPFTDVIGGFRVLAEKAERIEAGKSAAYEELSRACTALASAIRTHAADLMERMPAVRVPLEPFRVSEYHDSVDPQSYPRRISYVADYESTGRFLAEVVARWNDEGRLIEGAGLAATLADGLSEAETMSLINAELLVDVLQAEIDGGALQVADGKLVVGNNLRWLQFFDRVVREEKLISQDPAGWVIEADIITDLTQNNRLRIDVACLDDQMYLGMARPDLFIRLREQSFAVSYSKAILNIGLMLSLVVVLGVTASCVVKGPVSFFFTLTIFLIGHSSLHAVMLELIKPGKTGGGVFESAVLIVQHKNPNAGIDASETTQKAIGSIDGVILKLLELASKIIPDFSVFSDASAYISKGFDVPWNSSVLPSIMTFLGFLIPCVLIGAACLKFRELEAK